jgi:hypothetical protein
MHTPLAVKAVATYANARLPCLVVLTVEFRLQPAALTNIPDALYMEYALSKR